MKNIMQGLCSTIPNIYMYADGMPSLLTARRLREHYTQTENLVFIKSNKCCVTPFGHDGGVQESTFSFSLFNET